MSIFTGSTASAGISGAFWALGAKTMLFGWSLSDGDLVFNRAELSFSLEFSSFLSSYIAFLAFSACSFLASSTKSVLHSGHDLFLFAQSSIHIGWKIWPWPQWSSIIRSSLLKSSSQTLQHSTLDLSRSENPRFHWVIISPITFIVGWRAARVKRPSLGCWLSCAAASCCCPSPSSACWFASPIPLDHSTTHPHFLFLKSSNQK